MSGCCHATRRGLPVVPSLAFIVVSLVLADHCGCGSLNDGFVIADYRFRLNWSNSDHLGVCGI
jgi:hypothetical protein